MKTRFFLNTLLFGVFVAVLSAAITVPVALSQVQDVGSTEEATAETVDGPPAALVNPLMELGRYLATIGNCVSCHTYRDGPRFGGGGSLPPGRWAFPRTLRHDLLTQYLAR